ncbi:hypothetical protein [Coleofasciculus sp. FACHB-1120]|uniref:hypothetical protein n=1 Tax=Coleofasciculus sp. FACHB-1120 TaxID=2692783 RepID=UPI0016863845|nr:hypothetical protein [Coleofasciculus sp. FACHB-1120]MBD2743748.1 hypothetical protein [Coleofasciculus sp. FACHB-1120]
MVLVKGFYDDIHFTESNISGFNIVGNDLMIDIHSGLEIYPPHPLANSHTMSAPCCLIFKNVVSSQRTFSIYAGDPKKDGFKETKKVFDKVSEPEPNKAYEEYGVEGVLLEPKAWISWKIIAEEFSVDDLKE